MEVWKFGSRLQYDRQCHTRVRALTRKRLPNFQTSVVGEGDASMTPTARTLVLLRAEGYVCVVAEAWLPGVNRRPDLFGFADAAKASGKASEWRFVDPEQSGTHQ